MKKVKFFERCGFERYAELIEDIEWLRENFNDEYYYNCTDPETESSYIFRSLATREVIAIKKDLYYQFMNEKLEEICND